MLVQEKSTGILGMMLVIFRLEDMDTSTIAHESVHIADYYFKLLDVMLKTLQMEMKAYAYLVGWAAGCIANVLIKEKMERQSHEESKVLWKLELESAKRELLLQNIKKLVGYCD